MGDPQNDPPTHRVVTLMEAAKEASELRAAGRLAEARTILSAVIAKAPNHAPALHELGLVALEEGDAANAMRHMAEAIAASPRYAEAYINLGVLLLDEGDAARALTAFRAALAIDPASDAAERNLLHTLLYLFLDPEVRFADHLAFARRHEPPPGGVLPPPPNDRDPDRRLRIGILSSDLTSHPVGQNIVSVFADRDRSAAALVCYSLAVKPDEFTTFFKDHSDAWRDVDGLTDRAIADMIRGDAIDILLVVAGRFDRNRPTVACYRPAPVQMSLFDGATTGLRSLDYWVSDPVVTPPDDTERFSEEIVRVPLLLNRREPKGFPAVGPLPARANGFVTFGSLHRPSKISAGALDVWAAVLHQVPTARLAIKYRDRFIRNPSLASRIRVELAARGIDPERISFLPDTLSYLDAHNAIDIALDTFPFSGVTTTFNALAMGVPVVARAGDTAMWRMSAATLVAAGLSEWVASSDSAFIATAAGLAADLEALATTRAGLRSRIVSSPLCDGPAFARSMERLWRDVWRRWCVSSTAAAGSAE